MSFGIVNPSPHVPLVPSSSSFSDATGVSNTNTKQNCEVDELVKHALKALSGCVTGDKELDAQGATIAIVGKVSLRALVLSSTLSRANTSPFSTKKRSAASELGSVRKKPNSALLLTHHDQAHGGGEFSARCRLDSIAHSSRTIPMAVSVLC